MAGPDHHVRPTRRADVTVLRAVERRAGRQFRDYGLDDVADDEPPSVEELAAYADDGRSWVAVGPDDVPVGYILVDEIDGAAHIEQISVVPESQGRGLGKALIRQARQWAGARHLDALTLTTFSHIPWNRPLYEHLGFRVIPEGELGPGLRRVRDAEAAHGLAPALRVAMRLDIRSDPPARGATH